MEPLVPRDTARGIIIHDNQLMLIERWRDGLHYFSVPGGGIEAGETPVQTVERELHEETGCVVQAEREIYLLRFADGTQHHIFLCTYMSGEPQLRDDAPEALHQHENNRFKPCWVPLAALPEAPFLVWQSIKDRLLVDLAQGSFPETVQELV
jgi:8-oxo-dGTP diphosphatase